MTIYPPKGRNTRAAILVLPGGGYQAVAMDLEGTEICEWITKQGVTCILLKYRVGIPSEGGHPFRREGGHRSDVKAATDSETKAATHSDVKAATF
jgi:hypothetical protein